MACAAEIRTISRFKKHSYTLKLPVPGCYSVVMKEIKGWISTTKKKNFLEEELNSFLVSFMESRIAENA